MVIRRTFMFTDVGNRTYFADTARLNLSTLILAIVCALLLFTPTRSFAQATSGTLSGTVTDPSGAVIPNATVTITDADRGSSLTTTTNGDGFFSRTQLANGRYNVRVTASGFKTAEQTNIIVNIDRETRTNISLQPGEVQQAVQVVGNETPVLTTDRAEISTTIPARQLEQLPTLSQNVTSLELLAPGPVHT